MSEFLSENKRAKDLAYITELSTAFQKSRTLFTAMHYDIFTLIGERSLTSGDVADQLNLDKRGTDRLLNALASLKLLVKREFAFSNSESAKEFLVKGSSGYLGNMEHLSMLWDKWGGLTEAVRKGEPVNYEPLNAKDDHWIEAFVSSAHWKASVEAPEIIQKVDLRDIERVLDLGGGTGKFAVEFIRAKQNINAVVFDYPRVVEHSKEYIEKSGMSDKISVIGGDFLEDDIGKGYDLVFISSVLQNFSIWENVTILQKVYDALKVDGIVVIHDNIIDDDRTKPQKTVLHSLNLLVNTIAGDCYTETDIWIMMKEAWFKNIKHIKTDFDSGLMVGNR